MKKQQRTALAKFLGELNAKSSPGTPLSKQQLVSRFNAELQSKGQPLVSERDADIDLLFRKTVQDVFHARSALGGLGAESAHDAMLNSCWKVAFESALAAVFVRNKAFFKDNVLRALTRLKPIVMGSLRARNTDTDKALYKCFQNDANAVQAWNARKASTQPIAYPIVTNKNVKLIPDDKIIAYYEQVFLEENYENFFEEQLTAIYNFGDFVTRPHKFSAVKLVPEALKFTGSDTTFIIKQMIEDWAKYKKSGKPGWFDPVKEGNPSVSRQERQHTGPNDSLSIHTNFSGKYAGVWAVQGNRTVEVGNPYLGYVEDMLIPPFFNTTGVGLWRPMDSSFNPLDKTSNPQDEASIAMHRLDMPMVGGISGGMGTYLITLKWAGGNVTKEDLLKSFYSAYSVMISKGYHSFHEVAVVGESIGLWYRGGDYLSLLPPEWLDLIPDLKELVGRFEEQLLSNRGRSERNVYTFGFYKGSADPIVTAPQRGGFNRRVGTSKEAP
ncbi:hypothetical protein G4177_31935 [Corallococcus sp. ZKHCc1 1396]|uniref:Uncharacterized protein n=1 Tax=Corallococcus soli TaxID=2710757 RepID=A0ABR9PXX2_9BACT|nr:hypothetical protein [Corallococcus soli]MBE4752777.1 hypothetical protein [Corallococcus soli]